VQPGVPTGDVVFLLQAIPHESFERSGNDLLTHITITLSEALLGFSRVIITHLDGRGIKLSTPPGKIIKPQDSLVLRGEGMPLYRRPDEKGDLYVLIDIEMPDQDWLSSIDRNVSLSAVIFLHESKVRSDGFIYRSWFRFFHRREPMLIHSQTLWTKLILRKATLSMCVPGLFRLA
jgi:DnaJ-class molecular chaperone